MKDLSSAKSIRIEHVVDSFVWVNPPVLIRPCDVLFQRTRFTGESRKKTRNERRLARGWRPKHVRASV